MLLTRVLQGYHLRYGECRAPLLLENVQANVPIAVNIWMENFGFESNLQSIR